MLQKRKCISQLTWRWSKQSDKELSSEEADGRIEFADMCFEFADRRSGRIEFADMCFDFEFADRCDTSVTVRHSRLTSYTFFREH